MDDQTTDEPTTAPAKKVVEQFWQLMRSNDFASVGAVLADDFVLDYPLSGERFRGRERFAAVNAEYPAAGPWTFDVQRIVAGVSEAVSDVIVGDGRQLARVLSFFTIDRAGLISAMTEYWPEPAEPHDNRAHLAEARDED